MIIVMKILSFIINFKYLKKVCLNFIEKIYIMKKIRYKKTILILKYSPHNIPIIFPIVIIKIGLFN